MSFASPDIAYTTHPSNALLNAHFKSSVLMAVYLIGGVGWTGAALVGVGYTEQLHGTWALLPYALMAAMVLWFGMGALLLHKQEQHIELCDRSYRAYVKRQAFTTKLSVAKPSADAPKELGAFWGPYSHSASPTAGTSFLPVFVQPGNSIARSRTTAKTAAHGTATTLEVDLIASMTEHKPLRPISLFGSVQ